MNGALEKCVLRHSNSIKEYSRKYILSHYTFCLAKRWQKTMQKLNRNISRNTQHITQIEKQSVSSCGRDISSRICSQHFRVLMLNSTNFLFYIWTCTILSISICFWQCFCHKIWKEAKKNRSTHTSNHLKLIKQRAVFSLLSMLRYTPYTF